jgi:hypothetical protein
MSCKHKTKGGALFRRMPGICFCGEGRWKSRWPEVNGNGADDTRICIRLV